MLTHKHSLQGQPKNSLAFAFFLAPPTVLAEKRGRRGFRLLRPFDLTIGRNETNGVVTRARPFFVQKV